MTPRAKLGKLNEQRTVFRGVFVRYGSKNGYKGPEKTVLLRDIQSLDTGETLTDHLWFNYTKGFETLGEVVEGYIIEFHGRVNAYEKGYKGYRDDVFDSPISRDYRISYPTKIRKLEG